MTLPIESKIIALLNSEHGERIPAILEKSEESVNWATCDEFSQPILFRVIETLPSDLVEDIIVHVSQDVIQNLRDENSCSALHFAALNGNASLAQNIKTKAPALVNARDSEGCYPIHWASKHGKADCLHILIPDASVNVEDAQAKWTPLHYAANSNRAQVCEWLLNHGADKLKQDSHGRTALDIASERSYLSVMNLLQ